jgi:hypothetical protein
MAFIASHRNFILAHYYITTVYYYSDIAGFLSKLPAEALNLYCEVV